jgi:hypothetical protein
MSSYISDSQKGGLQAAFSQLHDTFGRDIVIYKTAQQITISTNPDNDYIWESSPNNDVVQMIPVSGVFKARIRYGPVQSRKQMGTTTQGKGSDQVNFELELGDVRLKLDATGAAFIKDAVRVVLDGDVFNVETPKRPHGLFEPQFYDFFLKRLN